MDESQGFNISSDTREPRNIANALSPEPHHFYIKKWEVILIISAILATSGFFILKNFYSNKFLQPGYEEIYTLVPDKISHSAAIPIRLPEGIKINVAEAKEKISFNPVLMGVWSGGKSAEHLVFKPSEKLDVGKYYSVILTSQDIKIQKDFLADEDPKIISVFPIANSESSEYSKITIVFNRPMVPLTALDVLKDKDIPAEISPATPGKYKWITTRNLQFIPEKRLARSSHYTLNIKPGFVSMDGLPVTQATYKFDTRPLRYENKLANNPQILYDEPLRIVFNQPIDILRTVKELTVKKIAGLNVEFIASYGTRSVYDEGTRQYNNFLDKSILEIYNKADQHGRTKLWDFNTTYTYILKQAYPLEGDINLVQPRSGSINISEIISGITAESPRSKFVEPDLYDPEGKLWVNFFEEVDKERSIITAEHLKEIGYGEKCRELAVGEQVRYGDDCEKVPDLKRIFMTFDPKDLKHGEQIQIHFKKIVNKSGLQVNNEEIIKTIITYPDLTIYNTRPLEGAVVADLTRMVVCTSNPLQVPDEKNFYDRVKSNVTVGLWNWYDPYRVRPGYNRSSVCAVGQFENTIQYGLVPQFPYKIILNIVDDFSQSAVRTIHFTSGKLLDSSRRFFSLQKEYNVTSPERTKFAYAVDNLEYLNLHICEVSAETMLHYIEDRPSSEAPPGSLNCTKVIEKQLDLPKKYWSRVYLEVNLVDYIPDPIGHYVLSFSHPDYRRITNTWDSALGRYVEHSESQIYERTYVTVTRLAVQEKKVNWHDSFSETTRDMVRNALAKAPRNLYWVSRFGSLDPVFQASVSLYQYTSENRYNSNRNVKLVSDIYQTGSDGVALTPAIPNLAAAIVKSGTDSAIVAEDVDRLQWSSAAEAVERTYIYTDKPIYRPGQQVFLKGIYRLGFDDNYEIFRDKKVDLEIRNSKYEVISKQSLGVSDYGTFTANVTLDEHAPLGTYSISAPGGTTYFDVLEYVPAAFKVEVTSDKEEYIAGDTLKLNVNADYYFGVPVNGGTVEYAIASQDFYFDRYQDDYFQFGNSWYRSFDGSYGDKFILRNNTAIDSHGKAEISQALDFSKFFKGDEGSKSKIFTINITAKNKSGQSISTQKSLIVHRGEIYAGVSLDKTFVGKNEKVLARIKTVDIKGKETSARDVLLEVKKITWATYKRREVDGNYYYQTEEKKETVQHFNLNTDSNGNASQELTLSDEGEYELNISAKDSRGNSVSAMQNLYVYGAGAVTVRPTNNETLDLATDKASVDVGENVKIVIKSPYPKAKALVSIERGTIFSYKIIDVFSNLQEYNFQVKDEYLPNVYVSVLLLSPRPEIKFGQIEYQVNTKKRELDVSVRSDKNNYLPGETVHLDVLVKDKDGNPVSSELSLAVVDMSVLALKGNPKKNPVAFFYNGTPLTVSTESNIKNILYEADIPIGTKGGSGGGGEELATKKRGIFKETSLWQGAVRTNSAGRASVSFILPDNLTTWQVESVSVTKDTKLGAGYSEFKTQKDLMVIPQKPRFIVPGDTFSVGGQIFNNTDTDRQVAISITSNTLLLNGNKTSSPTIPSRGSKTVYFSVTAPEKIQDGSHLFTLSAKSNKLEDTVENSINITRNNTYESVATANYTADNQSHEYVYLPPNVTVDRGGLAVKTSATLAIFLSDALNYLVEYPYGCSEQIASKLSSLAILKRGLRIKNIGDAFTLKDVEFEGNKYSPDDVARIGLARLYENQTTDGGFTYYKGMRPDFYLTLHVVNTLVDLKSAGYAVDASKLDLAAKYLYRELTQSPVRILSNDLVILTTYTLSRIDGYTISPDLQNRILTIAGDTKFIHENISNESLTYLAILLRKNYPEALKEKVFQSLENRIVIDARGAYLSLQGRARLYEYYETPIKDTALFLKAFAKDERNSAVLDKVLRWLLASRAKDGAWGSTNNTVTVIDALTDFLLWKKENQSSFKLAVSLDNISLGEFAFNKDTILKSFEKFIPTEDLGLGKMRKLLFSKTNQNSESNNYYYDMLLKYYLPIDKIPPRDEGFSVSREFYQVDDTSNKQPIYETKQGDVVRGHLTITVPESRNLVSVEDFIPAGMEIVNTKLATEDQSLQGQNAGQNYYNNYGPYDGDGGYNGEGANTLNKSWLASTETFFNGLFNNPTVSTNSGKELADDFYGRNIKVTSELAPDSDELHDDRLFLFKQHLEPGIYEYDYFVRALVPGSFHHLPAVVSEMYFPENFGRTRGESFRIIPAE